MISLIENPHDMPFKMKYDMAFFYDSIWYSRRTISKKDQRSSWTTPHSPGDDELQVAFGSQINRFEALLSRSGRLFYTSIVIHITTRLVKAFRNESCRICKKLFSWLDWSILLLPAYSLVGSTDRVQKSLPSQTRFELGAERFKIHDQPIMSPITVSLITQL